MRKGLNAAVCLSRGDYVLVVDSVIIFSYEPIFSSTPHCLLTLLSQREKGMHYFSSRSWNGFCHVCIVTGKSNKRTCDLVTCVLN